MGANGSDAVDHQRRIGLNTIYAEAVGTRPRVVIGPDGLPHCPACQGEETLCWYHRKQVRIAIGLLLTPLLLSGDRDAVYIMRHRRRDSESVDE